MNKINQSLTTEQVFQGTRELDTYKVGEIIEIMNNEDKTVAKSIERSLPQIQAAIEKIVEVMEKGGRLFYIGAGTSGRLGILDASECPPTFGVDDQLVVGLIAGGESAVTTAVEDAEDDENSGKEEVSRKVTSQDAVVGIAASGTTPYVLGAIEAANDMGVVTVGLSCNANTALSQISQFPIEVPVGPEVIAGSTRLKAGTAQKMVLNMISTTAMIKLGKVYGNLMVNMQATNQKLRRRVVEIVIRATGANEEVAKLTTDKANGDARAAILMIKYRIEYGEAIRVLEAANGHFRAALEKLESKKERT
ncbi:MAG TPA: N-acetylmuramic acid 6-phosphate etherase [Bacillales bacterium]